MNRRYLAGGTVIALALASLGCATPIPTPTVRATVPVCASVTIAERTPTGHEADMPVTLCGMRSGSWVCEVKNGELRANAKLACTEIRP